MIIVEIETRETTGEISYIAMIVQAVYVSATGVKVLAAGSDKDFDLTDYDTGTVRFSFKTPTGAILRHSVVWVDGVVTEPPALAEEAAKQLEKDALDSEGAPDRE